MTECHILAFGKLKGSEFEALARMYQKRIVWPLKLTELSSKKNLSGDALKQEEADILKKQFSEKDYVIALDENGRNLSSPEIADHILHCQINNRNKLVFILGGSDGLSPSILERANLKLSLGRPTWPHLMARVMLLEQIYRAQQIMAGHPYHRI